MTVIDVLFLEVIVQLLTLFISSHAPSLLFCPSFSPKPHLFCDVDSGPLVWWERNGVEVARAGWPQSGVRRTTVQVLNATRDELNAHYVCLAQNADVTDPLTASVVVKMHCE